MSENWERFCCRCMSSIGFMPERPDWCSICWMRRVPVPRDLLVEVERLRQVVRDHWSPTQAAEILR